MASKRLRYTCDQIHFFSPKLSIYPTKLENRTKKNCPLIQSKITKIKKMLTYPTIQRCRPIQPLKAVGYTTAEKYKNYFQIKLQFQILALSRNNIKNLNGLDAVGDTLEQLWISNNNIEKLKGVHVLKKLKVLFMANNTVKVRPFKDQNSPNFRKIQILTSLSNFQDWGEFNKLADLQQLVDLSFVGNPLQTKHAEEGDWMERVGKGLKILLFETIKATLQYNKFIMINLF